MFPITQGMRLVFAGDSWASNTEAGAAARWATYADFIGPINAQFVGHPTGAVVTVTGATASATGAGGTQGSTATDIVPIWAGRSGTTVHDQDPAWVSSMNPGGVLVTVGVNDITGGVSLAAFEANYNAYLIALKAAIPGIPIACFVIAFYYETWASGPLRWTTADVAGYNAKIQSVAAANGVDFFDWSSPLLAWEETYNPAKDAIGHLTGDGIHLGTAGKTVADAIALTFVTVVP